MISVHGVSKVYTQDRQSVTVLENISLEIDRGEIVGIVGYSGAGKSTLLRLFNGLETPSEGTVRIDGQDLSMLKTAELRDVRKKIGMIFQHFHLLRSRTVRENIELPLEIAGRSKACMKERVDQLLKQVDLVDKQDLYPSQLSGGQKQRVGIARALANDPDILLCDEATSALDPETTSSIVELLKNIHQETGITLVLISHEMNVIRSICHQVAVMEKGSIVEMGKVKAVFQNPQHVATRQLLQEVV